MIILTNINRLSTNYKNDPAIIEALTDKDTIMLLEADQTQTNMPFDVFQLLKATKAKVELVNAEDNIALGILIGKRLADGKTNMIICMGDLENTRMHDALDSIIKSENLNISIQNSFAMTQPRTTSAKKPRTTRNTKPAEKKPEPEVNTADTETTATASDATTATPEKLTKAAMEIKNILGDKNTFDNRQLNKFAELIKQASDPTIGFPLLLKMHCPDQTEETRAEIASSLANDFQRLKTM